MGIPLAIHYSRRAPHVGAPTIAVRGTAADCGLRTATCVIHRIRGGLPTREPLRLRSLGPQRPADCDLRPAFSQDSGGTPFRRPLRCGPWDRGDLRTATCDLRYPQDSGGTPFGRPLRCGPWDRGGLRTATGDLHYPQDSRRAPHVGAPTVTMPD